MKKILSVIFVTALIISCSGGSNNISTIDNNNNNSSGDLNGSDTDAINGNGGSNTNGWLIPFNEIIDGGTGKDGIPSIDNPIFTAINSRNTNYLKDDDLVVGIIKNGEVKAYPYPIMNWHEIVNDDFNGRSITINYCPLTGTAFAWDSKSGGKLTTFGESGLLYNNNLILYDRRTGSKWSQLKLQAVNGSLIKERPNLSNVIETDWKTWKTLYPNSKILSTNTGFDRNYSVYPYGNYREKQDFFLFPVSPLNDALPHKERVYAILANTTSTVYRFQNFQNGKAIKQKFDGKNYLVVGNGKLINSFELNASQATLNYSYNSTNSSSFFTDDEGNTWSVFGKATTGPRTGQVLKGAKSVVSYWFALAAFYPNPIISTD